MEYKTDQLVCVLSPFFKYVAFFCGECRGIGSIGTTGLLKCGKCYGKGLRTERVRALKFSGIGRIRSSFTANGVRVYTVVLPHIADSEEGNTVRTRDVSIAYWNQVSNGGTMYNTITTQVPEHHLFRAYIDMLREFPEERKRYMKREIEKLGGMTDVYQEDPDKITNRDVLKKSDLVASPQPGDMVTAVTYRTAVLRYFKCTECDGSNVNCVKCFGGGKEPLYVPQFITEGVVKLGKISNTFCEYELAPIPYVDDKNQILSTHNYWINRSRGNETRPPKDTSGLTKHMFQTSALALDWLDEQNLGLLKEYVQSSGRTPFSWPTAKTTEPTTVSDVAKFPKAVAIEQCLR